MARTDEMQYKDMKMLFVFKKKLKKNLYITADYFESSPGKVGMERKSLPQLLLSIV